MSILSFDEFRKQRAAETGQAAPQTQAQQPAQTQQPAQNQAGSTPSIRMPPGVMSFDEFLAAGGANMAVPQSTGNVNSAPPPSAPPVAGTTNPLADIAMPTFVPSVSPTDDSWRVWNTTTPSAAEEKPADPAQLLADTAEPVSFQQRMAMQGFDEKQNAPQEPTEEEREAMLAEFNELNQHFTTNRQGAVIPLDEDYDPKDMERYIELSRALTGDNTTGSAEFRSVSDRAADAAAGWAEKTGATVGQTAIDLGRAVTEDPLAILSAANPSLKRWYGAAREAGDVISDAIYGEDGSPVEQVVEKVFNPAQNVVDDWFASSEEHIAKAKEGLGAGGKLMVDLGIGAADLVLDAAVNAVAPGAGLANVGVRVYGSKAKEIRDKGGSLEDQMIGGLTSAGIEILTEKIAGPFEEIYGRSVVGSAINTALEQLDNPAVRRLLSMAADGLGEDFEEMLSDVLNAYADRINDLAAGPDWKAYEDLELSDVLYDGLVGGILGLVGGAVKPIDTQTKGTQTAEDTQNAQEELSQLFDEAMEYSPAAYRQIYESSEGGSLRAANQILRNEEALKSYIEEYGPLKGKSRVEQAREIAENLRAEDRVEYPVQPAQTPGERLAEEETPVVDRPRGPAGPTQDEAAVQAANQARDTVLGFLTDPKAAPSVARQIVDDPTLRIVYEALTGEELPESRNKAKEMLLARARSEDPAPFADSVDVVELLAGQTEQQAPAVESAANTGSVAEDGRGNVQPATTREAVDAQLQGEQPSQEQAVTQPEQPMPVSSPAARTATEEDGRGNPRPRGRSDADKAATAKRGYDSERARLEQKSPERRGYLEKKREEHGEFLDGLNKGDKVYLDGSDSPAFEVTEKTDDGMTLVFYDADGEVFEMERVLPDSFTGDTTYNTLETAESVEVNRPGVTTEQTSQDAAGSVQLANENEGISNTTATTETLVERPGELNSKGEGQPSPAVQTQSENPPVQTTQQGQTAAAAPAGTQAQTTAQAPAQSGEQGEAPPKAKLSQFWTNTLQTMENSENVPDDVKQPLWYLPIPEAESLARAASALAQDEQGTVEKLVNATAWDSVQNDSAYMIRGKLYRDAVKSGDWSAYDAWRKIMRQHETATAQGLQANAKYTRHTGEAAVDHAVEALSESGMPKSEQYDTVNEIAKFAQELDSIEDGDRASLIDLIMRLAKRRGNSTIIKGNLKKSLMKQSEAWLKEAAYRQLEGMTRDALNRGTQNMANKLASYRVLAMLSGLPTIGRNIEGNTSFGLIDLLSASGPGRAIDALVANATGQRLNVGSRGPFWKTIPEWLKNAATAMEKSMVETALDIDMDTRNRPMEMTANSAFVADSNPLERMFQRWSQILSYALTSTDRFYRGGIETGERANYEAFDERQAAKGKAGTGLTEAEQAAAAERTADYRLFQNRNAISEWAKANRRYLNNLLGIGGEVDETGKRVSDNSFGLGSLVMPFIEVPTNLALKAVEYGPANIAKGGYELIQLFKAVHENNISSGEKTSTAALQQRAVMDTARGLTGTGLLILATALARAGIVRNGDDEEDYNVAAVNNLTGQSGTQINLSAAERALKGEGSDWRDGDTVIGMAGISPLDIWLNAGTKFAALEDEAGAMDYADAYLQGTISSVLDVPMFSTMADMTNTLRDAESFTLETAGELAGKEIDSWGSGFIPQFVRQAARAADDYQRDTAAEGWLESRRNTLFQYLPGLRETLPEKIDSFGEPKEQAEENLRWLNGLVSPNAVNELETSPVIDLLADLYESTGTSSFYPNRKAPAGIGDGEDRIELTAEQKRSYQETQGQAYADGVEALMKAAGWDDLSDEQKAAAISKVKTEARHEAEAAIYDALGIDKELNVDNWEKLDPAQRTLYLVAKAGADALYDENGNITDYKAMDTFLKSTAFRALRTEARDVLTTGKLSRLDDMADAAKVGISSEKYDRIYKEWKRLGGGDQHSTEAAEALNTFIAGQKDLTAKQKEWLGDEMRFWRTMPVTTDTMDKFTAAGVKAASAEQLAQGFRELKPVGDYAGVQNAQKYQAIASAGYLTDDEKWSALFSLLGDNNKKCREEAERIRGLGYTYDEWAAWSSYCVVKTSKK